MNSEIRKQINATLDSLTGLNLAALDSLAGLNLALRNTEKALTSTGPTLWVNVYRKGDNYHCGDILHATEDAAKGWRHKKLGNWSATGASRYVGTFPVDIGLNLSDSQDPVFSKSRTVSLADMDYIQQEALLQAAFLYYFSAQGKQNMIFTIKYIRTLTMTASLRESKQLVEYAVKGLPAKPAWFKSSPFKPRISNQDNGY